MGPRSHAFDAVIEDGRGGGALVVVPFDAKEAFGSGRPKIVATFDSVSYRGSIASMGGRYILGMTNRVREEVGKGPGDTVRVTVRADTAPRVIAVPEDLAEALEEAGLQQAFEALSYTNRRETVSAIETAKKAETRSRRIDAAVDRLRG